MKYVDDRTEEQKKTHTILVVGTDKFMSGWGESEGGTSIAVWACRPEHQDSVFEWVKSRPDMKRVRIASDPYLPTGRVHCHVYFVGDHHQSLQIIGEA